MGVLERNAVRREIAKQDLPVIFQAMLDAERVEHDPMKQMHLQTTFSLALREKTPSQEFLKQLRGFLEDKSNSKFERDLLLGAIESASTIETVSLLIEIATTSPDKELRQSASAGFSSVERWSENLSPAIDRAWRESSDRVMLTSTSVAMAKIGAANSIELLLTAALAKNGSDDVRKYAAQYALKTAPVLNPKAVAPLVAVMTNQPPTSEAVTLASGILAYMGDPAAAKALLGWFEGADDSAAPLAQRYAAHTRGAPAQMAAWESALNPVLPFHSEKIREAIRAGIAEYHKNHP